MVSSWFVFYSILAVSFLLVEVSAQTDTITTSQLLRENETLVSNGGSFELGFFSPGSSQNRYLGIWYRNIPVRTVVWVANRVEPIRNTSGLLTINGTGSLVLQNGTNGVVWSTLPVRIARNPVVQLLDSGNLVVRDDGGGDYLWQSFDYPSDTLLPGMKLGWDFRTNFERRLTSWRSLDDPSPGELSIGIELDAYPQKVMMRGTRKFFRGGPWNGLRFNGAPDLKSNPVYDYDFILNEDEVYYIYQLHSESVISRLVLNDTMLTHQRYVWVEAAGYWQLYMSGPHDHCDEYNLCGANGICIISESPICQCLKGFKPNSTERWNSMDWSSGCIPDEPLNCSRKYDFVKFSDLKLPDTKDAWVSRSLNLRQCKEECLKNCSCMAYTNLDISGEGNQCALWFGDLLDIRELSEGAQDLYIRMPASNQKKRTLVIVVTILPIAVFGGLILSIIYCLIRRKSKAKGKNEEAHVGMAQKENLDLPFLDLATVSRATNSFSRTRKLGEGGFGPVYKGVMDGQEIAVKRLSKSSGQGLTEFMNEVKLIAKLQHRNLVRLLGYCIKGEEKLLIYEYMPNGSLDAVLFDQKRGSVLDWPKRFNIICGIARGLLYLHQDSRLRIIHRDLKPSNVLLDNELNPKISDFGMARTFGGDQAENTTKRIVGTYGYMAPEYAVYGTFSVKSDVFSFGILLLEIVSGKKSIGFNYTENNHNLIGYVWKLWTEGIPLEIINSSFQNLSNELEMIRCIHVALLCLQQNPDDRPTMSTVVLMLNGESLLPQPKQPGFLIDIIPSEARTLFEMKKSSSVNDITITVMDGR